QYHACLMEPIVWMFSVNLLILILVSAQRYLHVALRTRFAKQFIKKALARRDQSWGLKKKYIELVKEDATNECVLAPVNKNCLSEAATFSYCRSCFLLRNETREQLQRHV
ncbi:hypothetical protein ACJX0J_035206, partial [Zea mays]